jgi:serine/threonine protein kinase
MVSFDSISLGVAWSCNANSLVLAFHNGEIRPTPRMPAHPADRLCAPEVMFCKLSAGSVGSDWGRAVDVYTAACTLVRFRFGRRRFRANSEGTLTDALIHLMVRLGGPIPEAWKQYWDLNDYMERWKSKLSEYVQVACPPSADPVLELPLPPPKDWWDEFYHSRMTGILANDRELNDFLQLLQTMLVMDPSSRPTAVDILQHSWFTHNSITRKISPSSLGNWN